MNNLGDTSSASALIPGRPDELHSDARIWRDRAASYDLIASGLGAIDLESAWHGSAAVAAHELIGVNREVWRQAADTHRSAAEHVDGFAGILHDAQNDARRAMSLHADAAHMTSTARDAYEHKMNDALGSLAPLGQPNIWLVEQFIDPGASARRAAQTLLDDARQRVHDAGDRAATILREADEAAAVVRGMLAGIRRLEAVGAFPPGADGRYRSGEITLATLSSMSAAQLTELLREDPGFPAAFAAASTDPAAVASWWNSMNIDPASTAIVERPSPAQLVLIEGIPSIIGNLDGVAFWARDRANNITLTRALADPRTDLDTRKMLTAIQTALGKGMRGPSPRELVSLELGANPTAAISIGDLDRAVDVSYLVPGMGTTVTGNMSDYSNAAYGLRSTQAHVARVNPSTVAVVAWLNYTPPNSSDVIGVKYDYLADAGAIRLSSALGGFQAVHAASGVAPQLSVVAHSYGTDVATLALTKAHADHLVLLGSAGVSILTPNVAALHVPAGQVFASQGEHDGWAPVGQALSGREDPTAVLFGAHDFSSEASTDAQGSSLHAISQHGPLVNGTNAGKYSYLDNNTTAQYNTARATMGQGSQIAVGDTPGERLLLQATDRVNASEMNF